MTQKTTTIKLSKAEKLNQTYLLNKQCMKALVDLSELEYNQAQFDIGLLFLGGMYPSRMGLGMYFDIYSRKSAFWSWWMIEWSKWENNILSALVHECVEVDAKQWYKIMRHLAYQLDTEKSFNNYQKYEKEIF